MNNQQAFHIHAIQLPHGTKAQDWWIANGNLQSTPIANAMTLPRRFVIPAMVDAHTHLSMDFGIFGLPDASDAVVQANLQNKARQGQNVNGVVHVRAVNLELLGVLGFVASHPGCAAWHFGQ